MGRQPALPENDRQKATGIDDARLSVADVVARSNVHSEQFRDL